MKLKLITSREASKIIGISEQEIIKLAKEGRLPCQQVDSDYLRFQRGDVLKAKNEIRKSYSVVEEKVSLVEQIQDFFYFKGFYIISAAIIAFLLWLVFSKYL